MSRKKGGGANYGIQASNVTAGALAVGKGATATQNVSGGIDGAMLAAAMADLKTALETSGLPPAGRAVLEEDMAAIAAESQKAKPDGDRMETVLKGLAAKIKLAGQMTKGAADLIEPVKQIAAAIGLGATVLGLF